MIDGVGRWKDGQVDVRVRIGSSLGSERIRRLRSRFDLSLGELLCPGMEGGFGPVEKAARKFEFDRSER